jgi:hypothetical protein
MESKRSQGIHTTESFESFFINNDMNNVRSRPKLAILHSLFYHLNAMRPDLNVQQHSNFKTANP